MDTQISQPTLYPSLEVVKERSRILYKAKYALEQEKKEIEKKIAEIDEELQVLKALECYWLWYLRRNEKKR